MSLTRCRSTASDLRPRSLASSAYSTIGADSKPDAATRAAEKLYDEIESIQNDALYRGQCEQCEEAVRYEFVTRVADVIRNA